MAGRRRRLGNILGLVAALLIVLAPAPTAHAASGWDGSFDLYRKGTFTTQKSWLWCTAAGVQIVRNIVDRQQDHSTSAQRRYFTWMRARNRHDLPVSAGVDPAGWTAGLRRFVDDRYRLVSSRTFDGALRLAVKRMRLTRLPVALTVSHGGHGWILTGFSATADPAATSEFKVTSVRVVGPLYGLQSKNGYDMKPNTSLTTRQLKRFFTPWWYAPKRMIWDGRYISIQPVPAKAKPKPAPAAVAPSPTPVPSVTPLPTPSPSVAAAVAPSQVPDPTPAPLATQADVAPQGVGTPVAAIDPVPIVAILGAALALFVGFLVMAAQRSSRRIE